ncbi:MAG: hypothetical protein COT81_04860 [Candidatus Buchananbacteria bacterium CG10_big_fil_rev_8_21_14_0_10_42_9]|uniref:Enoyl reductase (ER) domain-containing protein n=1 Tax=Candidatus Buchananbacteria bacterium CG10_big_fil_rev_8_21_14_0_10_42_9 TaxID=1974526 RepID=A0A2H0W2K2_9BACT|nr:MAG: hypothetical protein COT81_04860 [Candidatus Buchananbacteria bacterium CG10_big_fil_rev_8_21_14_0_10_42_9]
MKAIVYTKPGGIKIKEVPKPKLSNYEVLLKIKAVGLCGTDLHIYKGKMDVKPPLIMGHEFSGIVVDKGPSVTNVKIGDAVVGEHVVTCKRCNYCKSGKPNLCAKAKVIGLHRPGALAEYLAIPADLVYKFPRRQINFEEAALIEPLSIAVYAVGQEPAELDKNVAVIGQGPIGLFLDQVLKTSGANVVGIDTLNHRLNFAKKKKWIDKTINPKTQSVAKIISHFAPDGVDETFEAVGIEATAQTAIDITRRDGHVYLLGVFESPGKLDLMKIVKKELNIHGSWTCAFAFQPAIDLVKNKKIDLKSLITHRYHYTQAEEAFKGAISYSQKRIKTVITF